MGNVCAILGEHELAGGRVSFENAPVGRLLEFDVFLVLGGILSAFGGTLAVKPERVGFGIVAGEVFGCADGLLRSCFLIFGLQAFFNVERSNLFGTNCDVLKPY